MQREQQREKLIEIIQSSVGGCARHWAEVIADGLLDNGVIVPPCKVGDTVYHVCDVFNEATLKCETAIVPRVIDFMTSFAFLAESKGFVIGESDFGNTVFLSPKAAEAALKERRKNDSGM